MKKKFKKTAMSLLLTASLVCGLSACSTAKDTPKQESTQKSTQKSDGAEPSSQGGAAGESGQTTASGDKKTFSYWLPIHAFTAKAMTDHNDHPAAKRLEEQTGVFVEYINPPVGQELEQMNLLLASGDNLPDLMRFNFKQKYRGGVSAAVADGVLLDATKLIEENAPNFMAFINSDEDLRRGAYTDDGILAYFGSIIPAEEMRGLPFQGPMVNKTLLDKAGLDIPETIADWEEMLAAFKEMGVRIPFSFGCDNKFAGLYNAFSGAYGVPAGSRFMDENGTAKFGPMQEGYKEFLTLFHKWYQNGWLDPDFLSKVQNKEVRNDFDAGEMGAGLLHISSVIRLPLVSVQHGKEEMEAVPAPYPVLKEGDQTHFRHYVTNFNQTPCYISADAEDPLTVIKWLDYLYSPEGIQEISWGTMGDERYEDTYYVDEEGKKKQTEFVTNNPNGLSPEEVMRQYLLRDTAMVWDWEMQSLMYQDERQQKGWSVWTDHTDFDYVMPDEMTMTADENDEFSKIMGDVETYVNEMSAKFIMGIAPLDDYDKFIKTLESMKVGRATEIQQAALDRYLAR